MVGRIKPGYGVRQQSSAACASCSAPGHALLRPVSARQLTLSSGEMALGSIAVESSAEGESDKLLSK